MKILEGYLFLGLILGHAAELGKLLLAEAFTEAEFLYGQPARGMPSGSSMPFRRTLMSAEASACSAMAAIFAAASSAAFLAGFSCRWA